MIEMNQIGNSQLADAHAFSHDEKAEVATPSLQFGKVPDSLIEGPGRLGKYAIVLYAIAASRDFKSSLNVVHVTGAETSLGQLDKMSEASFLAGLRELQERELLTRDQSHDVGGPVEWSRARDTWSIPTGRWQAMTVDEIRQLSVDAFALLTLVRKRRRIFVREAMEHLGYCVETTRKYLKELKDPKNGELIVRDGPAYRLRTDEARTSKFQGTGKRSKARKFGARENSKKRGAEEMRHYLDYPPNQKVRKTPLPPDGGPIEDRVVTKAASTRAPRQPRGRQPRLGDEVALAIAETFDPGPEVVDLVTDIVLSTQRARSVNLADWLGAIFRKIGRDADPKIVAKVAHAFETARARQRVTWLPAPIEVVAVYRAAASRLQHFDEARRELELAEAEHTEWREKHARLKCELDAADGLLPMSIELARAEAADALKRANSGERGIDGVVMDIAAGTRNKIPKIISVTGLPEHCTDSLKWIAFKFGETALPAILEAHNAQRSLWDHREPDRSRIDRLRKESQASTSDFAVVWPEQLKKVEKP